MLIIFHRLVWNSVLVVLEPVHLTMVALKCRDAIWMIQGESSDNSRFCHLKNSKHIDYCSETTAITIKVTVAPSMRTGTRKILNQFRLFQTRFGPEVDFSAYLFFGVSRCCLAFQIVLLCIKKSHNLGLDRNASILDWIWTFRARFTQIAPDLAGAYNEYTSSGG